MVEDIEKNILLSLVKKSPPKMKKKKYCHSRHSFWPSNSTCEHKSPKKISPKKNQSSLKKNLHSSTICKREKLETTCKYKNRGTVKQNLVLLTKWNKGLYSHFLNTELFSKEWE